MWRALGRLCGRLGYALRYRRAHVHSALNRAQLPAAIAPEVYARFGAHAVAWARGVWPEVRCSAALEQALSAHSGALVLCASHTSHWEAALAHLASRRAVLAIVTEQSQVFAQRFCEQRRRAAGVETCFGPGSVARALSHLVAGGVVVALGDQAPRRRAGAIEHAFLGAPCWLDTLPAHLAARAEVPLWAVAQWSRGAQVQVELLAEWGRVARGACSVHAVSRAASDALAAHVRAHPCDWLWTHRRWKPPRE